MLQKLTDMTEIAYMILSIFAVPLYLKLENSGSDDSLYRELYLCAATVMTPVLSTGINVNLCLFLRVHTGGR